MLPQNCPTEQALVSTKLNKQDNIQTEKDIRRRSKDHKMVQMSPQTLHGL